MQPYDYDSPLRAEYQRQSVIADFRQIRLEELASAPDETTSQGSYERVMVNLARWMIATGKQLLYRYDHSAACCSQKQSNYYA